MNSEFYSFKNLSDLNWYKYWYKYLYKLLWNGFLKQILLNWFDWKQFNNNIENLCALQKEESRMKTFQSASKEKYW